MKRKLFPIALLSVASLAVMQSCSKDDAAEDNPTTPKISSIVSTDKGGKDSISFVYTDGVLTSADHFKFSPSAVKNYSNEYIYKSGKLVNIYAYKWNGTTKTPEDKDSISYDTKNRIEKEFDYSYSNNKFVNNFTTTYEYNSNNQLVKLNYSTGDYNSFQYDGNGNVETIKEYDNNVLDDTENYTFDTKKNPFKGFPFFLGDVEFYNTNNPIKVTNDSGYVSTRTYEYNAEGYPVKITIKNEYPGYSPETSVYNIYYK